MMTNNTLNTRIQQIIDRINAADAYFGGLLDYSTVNRRSANDDLAEKRLRGPIEWRAGAGRILRVR
jgi:hypothetical protein